MRLKRPLTIVALALALTACSPAKEETPPPEAPAVAATDPAVDSATRTGILDALSAAIANDLGQQVDFRVDQLKAEGDWAWAVALPQALGGGPLDFSKTKYATQAAAGALDGGGVTYALLHRQDGVWIVKDFVVGPTDVAYLDWPQTYGAPASVMGLADKELADKKTAPASAPAP